ncbi:DNA polymerase/3'-5' exonuclease PolX [Polluticoccus soli]|uniref:DNA polymerase/3'-5' exonuclease PolX n=1 Tax=Polluticoccus soli TaxID=3034150 RepID=UPI0023E19BE2|nr:DNA polymerase/3'-5' exonuclease PolX [Flavipsychrobacter sp. JY13-12]
MTNYEIADHFSLLSKLMDIHGENSFKSKSYSIAAFNIEKLPVEIEDMDDSQLFSQKGIGESTGKKIREIQQSGKLDALEKIMSTTPLGVLEMLHIKGLGPKKISVIWKEMGIETLGELEYACNENRLAAIKGFGAKTQDGVLQSISYYRKNQGFHLWADVEETAIHLVIQLQKTFTGNLFALTGDMRRQNEVVEFVEIVSDITKETAIRQFEAIADTVVEEDPNNLLIIRIPEQPVIKFHLCNTAAFYHTLFATTGSSEFMKAFLEKYTLPATPENEEVIFTQNNLSYIQPAMRETAGILDKAAAHTMYDIIMPPDIKGIIHSHSTWSDGADTIETMAKAARDKGLEYLVISDHSVSAYYANGLSPERIAAQHQEIDALNAKLAPFKIFKSIEADILGDGSLDYNANILNTFDLVIASVHSNLKMMLEKAMSRVIAAVQNPFTTILGHPTGRLLLSREGYPIDHKMVIDACAAHDVVIEINAHPRRLDIDWRWIEYAMEKGVLLSIDPDAHSVAGYHDVYYGVMAAQKGGLTARHNLSSFSLKEFEEFLAKYTAKKQTKAVA